MQAQPSISVVVPTRERPAQLERCLRGLALQTVPVEIVVVDDGSAPASAAMVREAVTEVGGILVRTGGSGPAAARNAGGRAAAGGIILFTDDDCAAEPGWAQALARACPVGGSAAGDTVNDIPGDRVAAASQLLTSELMHATLGPDGRVGFAPTSNLAVARELFERLPFDKSFPAAAGEDRAWCAAAAELGAAPVYAAGAVVRHRQELGLRGFARQQFRYGRGAAIFRGAGGELAGGGVRRRLLRAGFREGPAVGTIAAFGQLAVAAGYATERLRARGR